MLVLLLPRLDLISNTKDNLASLLTFLPLFFLNEMFSIILLFQQRVAWEEYAGVSTGTGVCSELHEIAASINVTVIHALASALKRSVHSIAIEF